MATYDLKYPGAAIDAILDTAYHLQQAGYIFRGSASDYSGTPTEREWLIAPAGFTGYGISSPVPQGSIGICLYNGTVWVGKIINVATIDSTPTQNSGNAVSSGGAYAAINQLSANVTEALENLTFTDTTPSAFQDEYINFKVSTTEGSVEHILTYLTILAATTSKAGLMSAEDKAKVDSFLTGIRSMQFVDATTSAEQSIKLVEQLKWTVGGVQEVIDSITILAATSSKAGLLSASDKAYIDALPSALTNLSNSISAALALMESLVGYYVCDTAAATAAKTVAATGYTLTNGGCIRIKMTNANTADNATLNINSTGAKALYYDDTQASSTNTWEAGEVLEVYYDGTQYQCASGGGGKFATGEKVKDTDIVTSLQSGSNGLPTAGGVYNALEPLKQAVSQLNEQVLVKFDYTLESGKYYNGSGYTTNASFCSTSQIDVTGKDKIYVGATTTSASGIKTIYFINNGAVISSEMYTTLEKYKEVTLPAGTTHVILNTMVSTCHYPVVLYSTAGASRLDEIDEIAEDVYTTGQETIEYTTVGGLLSGDGTSVTSYNGYSTTDYIDVSSIDSVLVSATTASINGTVYGYDENKNAMFWLLGKGTYTSQQVDIPATVKYIRVNGSTSGLAVRKITYTPTSDSFQAQIDQIKADIYTAYKEIVYDESQNQTGFWGTNGVSFSSYSGFTATPFIAVTPASIIYVSTKVTNAGIYCCFAYDNSQNFLGVLLQRGTYNLQEIQLADNVAYIKMNGQGVIPKVYKKGVGFEASKKELNRNVNWVGMSIWWYDGRTLGGTAEVGGGVTAKGYQYLLKEQFKFLSDTGTSYCVSGASLGGTSESDSLSIAANMSSWAASANAIWTLDTITNDFRRNIPIGTTDDYNNDTGVTTYFGALRKFVDKVATLSGSDAIVIVSNSLRRNNSGYTSTSQNGNGDTLESFERALMYVVMKNNWYFVDQFRLSALSDNVLPYATLDGLHCNNTGYRLAVLPWIAVFDEIYNRFL